MCAALIIPLPDLSRTHAVGRALGRLLPDDAICLLYGELAAGKTTLIKAICAGMGIDPRLVTSPTYALVNAYQTPEGVTVLHADLYRLDSPESLESLDPDDWLNAEGPTFIEWPQAAEGALHDLDPFRFYLSHMGGPRQLRLEVPPSAAPLLAALQAALEESP